MTMGKVAHMAGEKGHEARNQFSLPGKGSKYIGIKKSGAMCYGNLGGREEMCPLEVGEGIEGRLT